MKKLLALSLVLFCTHFSFAQSPEKMSYQSVIRNATGELVLESPVGIQVAILQGSAGGAAVYLETHSATTNINGLASIEIGTGSMISGTFAAIDWGNGPYFVRTEIDPSGGVSYSMATTSELLSVPYALYAKTADSVSGLNTEGALEICLDVTDPSSNFPFPWDNEGGFVATFENTNTDNGDGIRIKLGKQRTEITPAVTLTPAEEEEAEQIRQMLDAETPLIEKRNILEGLILAGIIEDNETIAGLAIGAGNLIIEFINDGINLPLNVSEPINNALDYDFGAAINEGIGLPVDLGLIVNDGIGLPWNFTDPINSALGLPYVQCLPFGIGCFTFLPELPDVEIPGIPEETIGEATIQFQCPIVATPVPFTDDFEGEGLNWGPINTNSFANPVFTPAPIDDQDSLNTVLRYFDAGGEEASVFVSVDSEYDTEISLVDNHSFSIDVYAPVIEIIVIVEGDSTIMNSTEERKVSFAIDDENGDFYWITKPLVHDEWQTVTFDFATDTVHKLDVNSPDPLTIDNFSKISLAFDGEWWLVENTLERAVYLDNFSYEGTVLNLIEDVVVPEGTFCEYTSSNAETIETYTEQQTVLRIPGIPLNTLEIPDIPDFSIPAIPVIPAFEIGGLEITPLDPRDLESWGIPSFDFGVLDADALSGENEFIRFSDADDSKMGSIRAMSKLNWVWSSLGPEFALELYGIVKKGNYDKKHMRMSLKTLLLDKTWDYANIGVQYHSGFGDYAEWLERADPDERMRAGSIVGVVGGKISKDLTNAEQVMVVSHSPIVLGNVPEEGKTHLGNNIAFVGQLPVKVMGVVHTGDYIIGNPATPGYGYAKHPTEMSIEELNLAVGRSWEDNLEEGPKMVNTVVGVHNGDYVNILKAQDQELEAAENELNSAESQIESLESNMESILQILSVEANNK